MEGQSRSSASSKSKSSYFQGVFILNSSFGASICKSSALMLCIHKTFITESCLFVVNCVYCRLLAKNFSLCSRYPNVCGHSGPQGEPHTAQHCRVPVGPVEKNVSLHSGMWHILRNCVDVSGKYFVFV